MGLQSALGGARARAMAAPAMRLVQAVEGVLLRAAVVTKIVLAARKVSS